MGKNTKKELNKLLEKGYINEKIVAGHKKSLARVEKEIDRLRKQADQKQKQNIEKFLNLPKGIVFDFGDYEICRIS